MGGGLTVDKSWDHKGVYNWPAQYPLSCSGKRQSPVDILTAEAKKKKTDSIAQTPVKTPSLKLDLLTGSKDIEWNLVNNGHTFLASPPDGVVWEISGGLLEAPYHLKSMHAHWGTGKVKEGLKKTPVDTILAVGMLLSEVEETDPTVKTVIEETLGENLVKIVASSTETIKIPGIDLATLLPVKKINYFLYQGSLTTPPFSEDVVHIVLEKPVEISSEFMVKLRGLDGCDGQKLTFNYRSIQPICGRKVTKAK
ncbi:carbonic anhydrase 2-like isoform X2 [Convolutriloba macropyga]|uniref:carbonic anhydrase 2-like isoform X2 n=1 Tax=Convolutriloba macropyga TaxID=536237 RepID=UPI003F51E652